MWSMTRVRMCLGKRPVEDGKLAEPPDCDSPDRRCNLTDAAITSTTLLVDDIRIRRCRQRCTRVLQSHLKQLRRERSKTDALLKITLSSMQLYFVPPSYGRSGAHGRYSTGWWGLAYQTIVTSNVTWSVYQFSQTPSTSLSSFARYPFQDKILMFFLWKALQKIGLIFSDMAI